MFHNSWTIRYLYFFENLYFQISTEYKLDQLLKRIIELESMTLNQEEIISRNIDENKKINELLKDKQVQLQALLLIFATTVLVAALFLKIILVFNLRTAVECTKNRL